MFAKIFASILDSSVWDEPPTTRIVWITMLLMADEDGFVKGVESAVARRARVSKQECREALLVLAAPDVESQDQDYGGRRIEKVEGGWMVLNYKKYREMRTRDQVKKAQRQARWRQKKREGEHQDEAPEPSTERLHSLPVDDVDGIASASSSAVGSSAVESKAVEQPKIEIRRIESLGGPDGLAEHFADPDHRQAYLAYRRTHRMPDAYDAVIGQANRGGMGTNKPLSWDLIGATLLSMRSLQVEFSQNALHGFARNLERKLAEEPSRAPGEASPTVEGAIEILKRRSAQGGG